MNLARSVELLSSLIAFPTVSAESNLDLIEFSGEILQSIGARIQSTYNDEANKANLFATIGPDIDGGVILSGHTDVVPVEGQPWSMDPFQATVKDSRIYGRGACDMKAFIACALAMAPKFAQANLVKPVHFAFSFDEEVGCLGAPLMLDRLRADGITPSVCIIGEPTDMGIIEGHKGCYEYTTRFTGLEGHGSVPSRGVNAVEYAVRFVTHLMEVAGDLKSRALPNSLFDPPWSTIQTGRICGGIARNIIAGHCEVEWEMRPVTETDARFALDRIHHFAKHTLDREMKMLSKDTGVVTHVIGEVEGLEPMPQSEALGIVKELTGEQRTSVVSFGTEAGLYQKQGIATVVCGPGSICQAHKPDEYVQLDQLQKCLDMLDGLVSRLSG